MGQTAKGLLGCPDNKRQSGKVLIFGARGLLSTGSVNLGELGYFFELQFPQDYTLK